MAKLEEIALHKSAETEHTTVRKLKTLSLRIRNDQGHVMGQEVSVAEYEDTAEDVADKLVFIAQLLRRQAKVLRKHEEVPDGETIHH